MEKPQSQRNARGSAQPVKRPQLLRWSTAAVLGTAFGAILALGGRAIQLRSPDTDLTPDLVFADPLPSLGQLAVGQTFTTVSSDESAAPAEATSPSPSSQATSNEAWPETPLGDDASAQATTTPPTGPATATASTAVALDPATVATDAAPVIPGDEANAEPARLILEGTRPDGSIMMTVNRTQIIKTASPISRISVGQPAVADINTLAPNLLLLTAKAPGSTQLIVWDENEASQVVDVSVQQDLQMLAREIRRMLPHSAIEVGSMNGTVTLRGTAASLIDAQRAVDLASPFGRVLNLIEIAGGQQVMLQVQFAEVSRSVSNTLGVNWAISGPSGLAFGSNTGTGDLLGLAAIGGGVTLPEDIASNIFGNGGIGGTQFAYFLDALKTNNLLRTLAEPNQVVLSGEESEFLAGGELPVPVPSQDGIAIEYKRFGVRLTYRPVVLGNGRIRMSIETEVSDVDPSISTPIPGGNVLGFTNRSSRTVVELAEGQTLPIAGLLSDNTVAATREVPGLGRLPILGALFRSTKYQRRETELVILITPKLVEAIQPQQIGALPGDGWRHPSEWEQLLRGDIGGDNQVDQARDWQTPPSQRPKTNQPNPTNDASLPPTSSVTADPTSQTSDATATATTVTPRSNVIASEPAPPLFIGDAGFAPMIGESASAENPQRTQGPITQSVASPGNTNGVAGRSVVRVTEGRTAGAE
jgi:pilus assembly protein CpaC